MKYLIKFVTVILTLSIIFTTFALPSYATNNAVDSISPYYMAVYCSTCNSSNTSFQGYTFLFLDTDYCEEGYAWYYYNANYECNNCGQRFAVLFKEYAPL